MMTGKHCNKPMRTLSNMPDLPIHPSIRRWADGARRHPDIKSVILFGSRTHGTARPDSDWDVALVVAAGSERQIAQTDIVRECYEWAPAHGAVVVAEDRMLRDGSTYATIASEIASGVVLGGANYDLETSMGNTLTPQASQQYCTMMLGLWDAVSAEAEVLTATWEADLTMRGADLGKYSADAAEYATMLLCLSLGVSFSKQHNLHALSCELPLEWQETVKSLNGRTHKLHMGLYGEANIAQDDVPRMYDETKTRLRNTLSLVERIAGMPMPLSGEDSIILRDRLVRAHAVFAIRMKQARGAMPDIVDAATRARAAVFDAIGTGREEPDRPPKTHGIGGRCEPSEVG